MRKSLNGFMVKRLINFFVCEKEAFEIIAQIYSQGKGADSPGGFRYERTGKID